MYSQLGTRGTTELSLIYTYYSSPLHTHYGSQSSLVISWQWIYKSLAVTAKHTKSPFQSLFPFFPVLLSHSTAISRDSLNCDSSSSQSHIATEDQSFRMSWCRPPFVAHDQMILADL
jgi:hypothetical protein